MIGDSFSDAAKDLADALEHYADEVASLPDSVSSVVRCAVAGVDAARQLIDWSQNTVPVTRYHRSGADVLDPETLARFGGYHRAERQGE